MTMLRFGFSPCPNDTFAFHALTHGLVDVPAEIVPVMEDIEALNRLAHSGELELTKLSFGALAQLGEMYVPLRSGAALGHGVGPLVVARDAGRSLDDVATGSIAIPGRDTTAYLLLRLALGDALDRADVVELRYDEILGAVASGDVDAGLIIHESRFTYSEHGLHRVADMGEWWHEQHGLPVPLAAICARHDVAQELRPQLERALRDSVSYAFAHPDASAGWVDEHAQELEPDVRRQHIELYVNEHTVELDSVGMTAIETLLAAARA
jgi:1,4-dihydroxy-6-naphthoate synthase